MFRPLDTLYNSSPNWEEYDHFHYVDINEEYDISEGYESSSEKSSGGKSKDVSEYEAHMGASHEVNDSESHESYDPCESLEHGSCTDCIPE